MDMIPAHILEQRACAALQDAELTASQEARDAIARIPAYLMSPAVIAAIATSLHAKAEGLGPASREIAQGYLHDLIDDMQAAATHNAEVA